jgi:hypothetical protein
MLKTRLALFERGWRVLRFVHFQMIHLRSRRVHGITRVDRGYYCVAGGEASMLGGDAVGG